MAFTKNKMESILGKAEMAITNSLKSEEIKTLLMEYNYDEDRLNEGMALQQTAKNLYQDYIRERGEQLEATSKLEKTFDEANPVYIEHITLARLTLRHEPEKKVKFSIDGQRKKDTYGWIEQAELFYNNCLEDEELLNKLLRYNLTREKLEAGMKLIIAVKTANQVQEKEKSESQDKRQDRDDIFYLLNDWMTEFLTIARFALNSKPELLEKLGVFVPSE